MKFVQPPERSRTARANRTVLCRSDDGGLTTHQPRRVDRLAARLHSGSLDHQLAAGVSPDTSARLALRAGVLVTPAERRSLARHWVTLLERAEQVPNLADPRAWLPRARILAARPEIAALVAALRGAGPVAARGVAQAGELLTDGGGPVYSRASRRDLRAAVRAATDALDPLAEFSASLARL